MKDVKVRKSEGNKPKHKAKKKWYNNKETASKKKASQKDLESLAELFNNKYHKG